jgi:hypothetical protein
LRSIGPKRFAGLCAPAMSAGQCVGLWALGDVLTVRCSDVDVDVVWGVDMDEAGSDEGRLLEWLPHAKERPMVSSEKRLFHLGPIMIATELPGTWTLDSMSPVPGFCPLSLAGGAGGPPQASTFNL